jgi:MFS family permease
MRTTWALLLLTAAMGMNQLDRGVVAILLQSIKKEMSLSDTMLGLMTGLGFSVVYALASIPFGRLADRANRVNIVSFGMLFYSAMALSMGFAGNVVQLIAARSAVAVGEATGSAPSTSMISDLYPRKSRGRALGIWASGTYIGLFIGLTVGGWIHQHYGWRVALWATAAPGILIALLIKFTVREPKRGASDTDQDPISHERPSFGQAIRELLTDPAYRAVLFAIMCATFVNYSFSAWVPSLLGRVHNLDEATIGLAAGFFKGLLGLCGALAGGFATHYLAKGRLHGMASIAAASSLLLVPCMLLFLLAPSTTLSLIGLGFGSLLIPVCQAPAFTMVQSLASPGNRAFAMTVLLTSSSLFGLGLGPLATGAVSDALSPGLGAASLQYALLLPTALSLVAGSLFALSAIKTRRSAGRYSRN